MRRFFENEVYDLVVSLSESVVLRAQVATASRRKTHDVTRAFTRTQHACTSPGQEYSPSNARTIDLGRHVILPPTFQMHFSLKSPDPEPSQACD